MVKKYFTRKDIQDILEKNNLNAPVTYGDREQELSMDSGNAIVYSLVSPRLQPRADDVIHMRRYQVQVVHFHKKKLDSIAGLMYEQFNVVPTLFGAGQINTDWIADYYHVHIFTDLRW